MIPNRIGSGNHRAPELIDGKEGSAESRTCRIDIFSLGCISHDMLNANAMNMMMDELLEHNNTFESTKKLIILFQSMQSDLARRPSTREVVECLRSTIQDISSQESTGSSIETNSHMKRRESIYLKARVKIPSEECCEIYCDVDVFQVSR